MKYVLHDWDDADALRILAVLRRHMPATARLVVIERFVGPPNQDPVGKFADLGMLVGPGGRERSREELAALLHESGLHVASVTTTGTPLNVLIAEREPA